MAATKPVDLRKGAEGPAALVRETMTADRGLRVPAKRADRDKLILGMIHIDHLENHLVMKTTWLFGTAKPGHSNNVSDHVLCERLLVLCDERLRCY